MTKSQITNAILIHGLAFALALTASVAANASVSSQAMSVKVSSVQATKDALDLPMLERVQQLKGDSHAYENLKTIMFNTSASMDLRWKAVTSIARVSGEKAKPDLVKALQSSEWFMRNAALIAMANVDRSESLAWARKFMNDKALVVRLAAVDAIAKSRDGASTSLLWEKLNSKENFRNRQSLFIRRRIVEVLAQIDGKGHEAKFVGLLQDKDASLHEPAMEALTRITNHTVGSVNESMQIRRAQWQQWYKANKASL